MQRQKTNFSPYSNSTVLIADDDEVSYSFLKVILTKYNIKTLRARNGQEALDTVTKKDNINLILMDIKMPLMDGLDATKAIINTKKCIPVVAQTAYASESDKKKVAEAGCVGYITKPIDTFELDEVLKKYLIANIT